MNGDIYDDDHDDHDDHDEHVYDDDDDDYDLAGKKLVERIEDLLELKMNMKRKISLKRVVRQKGSNSNAPPLIVTFEEQVGTIQCVNSSNKE